MEETTATIRFGIAILMLVVASISDLRTRRVPNHYWSFFVAMALVFIVHDLSQGGHSMQSLMLAYGLALGLTALWYGLWYFGSFGGADAKGLMVLVWLLPWPNHPMVPVPPALDAVTNGTLMVLVLPLLFLLTNIARGALRFPAALLGVPMSLEAARAKQVWPMERVDSEGRLTMRYWSRIGADMGQVYRDLQLAGVQRVWTTPKVPFMVPLLMGLLVAIFHGNLILHLLLRL